MTSRDRLQNLAPSDQEQLRATWRFSYRFLTALFGLMGLAVFALRGDLAFLIGILVMDAAILALVYAGLFFYVPWAERFGRTWRLKRQGIAVERPPQRISPRWKIAIGASVTILFLVGLAGYVGNTVRESGVESISIVGVLFYLAFILIGLILVARGQKAIHPRSQDLETSEAAVQMTSVFHSWERSNEIRDGRPESTRISPIELSAHLALALTAAALGLLVSSVLRIPPYTIETGLIVIGILVPEEFLAIVVWNYIRKHRRIARLGILPPRGKV